MVVDSCPGALYDFPQLQPISNPYAMDSKLLDSRWLKIALIIVILLGVGVLWNQIFIITGIIGSQSAMSIGPVPPPNPPEIKEPRTDWVDLQIYLRTHPVWEP